MTEIAFASQCERFLGQTAWVVGRGPTLYEYKELGQTEGPVFFVNDAVGQERWLDAERPCFFFAHDISLECWLGDKRLRSVPVLLADQPVTGPPTRRNRGLISGVDDPKLAGVRRAIFYTRHGPLEPGTLLSRSRGEIRLAAQLYCASGTLHPLLHFAWYCGCSRIRFIGCDGLPGTGYDPRLENRSGSAQDNALAIRVVQEAMLRTLGVPFDYLGSPPRRIKMIMEMRMEAARREAFLAWAEPFQGLLRSHGCSELVVNDWVNQGRGYWINGTWPSAASYVQCQASREYRDALQAAHAILGGAPNTRLRISYQAVP